MNEFILVGRPLHRIRLWLCEGYINPSLCLQPFSKTQIVPKSIDSSSWLLGHGRIVAWAGIIFFVCRVKINCWCPLQFIYRSSGVVVVVNSEVLSTETQLFFPPKERDDFW